LTWINNYNGIDAGPLAALRLPCVVGGPRYAGVDANDHAVRDRLMLNAWRL
jgi:hypothetical protein